jgi:hypothetical protein
MSPKLGTPDARFPILYSKPRIDADHEVMRMETATEDQS